jgi:hypothetical protein
MVYHIAASKMIEHHKYYHILNKYAVSVVLIIVVTTLVEISSVYSPAGAETQLLQLPPIPPLLPPGGPPIDLPGLPPIQAPPSQHQQS